MVLLWIALFLQNVGCCLFNKSTSFWRTLSCVEITYQLIHHQHTPAKRLGNHRKKSRLSHMELLAALVHYALSESLCPGVAAIFAATFIVRAFFMRICLRRFFVNLCV